MQSKKNVNLRPWAVGKVTDCICRELWVVGESEDELLTEALFALVQEFH